MLNNGAICSTRLVDEQRRLRAATRGLREVLLFPHINHHVLHQIGLRSAPRGFGNFKGRLNCVASPVWQIQRTITLFVYQVDMNSKRVTQLTTRRGGAKSKSSFKYCNRAFCSVDHSPNWIPMVAIGRFAKCVACLLFWTICAFLDWLSFCIEFDGESVSLRKLQRIVVSAWISFSISLILFLVRHTKSSQTTVLCCNL